MVVDLDGDGPEPPCGAADYKATIQKMAPVLAQRLDLTEDAARLCRNQQRLAEALRAKYFDLVADQARATAVRLYTAPKLGEVDVSFLYRTLNFRLRQVSMVESLSEEAMDAAAAQQLGELFPFFKLLQDGLRALPGYDGPLIRGQVMPEAALDVYRTAARGQSFISMPTFTSFSENEKIAQEFIESAQARPGEVRVIFRLNAKDRRQIGGRSEVAKEREVLMEAFSAFLVQRVERRGRLWEIRLADLQLRLEAPREMEENDLHLAADVGDVGVIRRYTGRFDWLDSRDGNGRTPLARAFGGDSEGARRAAGEDELTKRPRALGAAALIAAGCDVDARDSEGRTPLYLAAFGGDRSLVAALLAAGADVNATKSGGRTPLFAAARSGHAEIVGEFVKRGAKLDQKDNSGTTPEEAARGRGHSEVAAQLRAARASGDLTAMQRGTPTAMG